MKTKKYYVIGLCILCSACLLVACGSLTGTVINSKYTDQSIPVTEQSMVYLDKTLEVVCFNDIKSKPGFIIKEFKSTELRDVVSFIPSGKNTFILNYYNLLDVKNNSFAGSTTLVYESSNNISIAYDFLPGRFYYIHPFLVENSIRIIVSDVTDTTDQHLMNLRDTAIQKKPN